MTEREDLTEDGAAEVEEAAADSETTISRGGGPQEGTLTIATGAASAEITVTSLEVTVMKICLDKYIAITAPKICVELNFSVNCLGILQGVSFSMYLLGISISIGDTKMMFSPRFANFLV